MYEVPLLKKTLRLPFPDCKRDSTATGKRRKQNIYEVFALGSLEHNVLYASIVTVAHSLQEAVDCPTNVQYVLSLQLEAVWVYGL